MTDQTNWTGKEFEGKVFDLSVQGLGIIRDEASRCVFFVAGAWPGEDIRFRVTSMTPRYGMGELLEIKTHSPDRRTSPCPYHGIAIGQCGGCPWMGIQYAAQLEAKQKIVESQFERFKISCDVKQIIGAPEEFGYRNRAQLKTDGTQLGFVSQQSRQIVDVETCLTLTSQVQKQLEDLRQRLPNNSWRPSGTHDWNFMDIDGETQQEPTLNRRQAFRQANDAQNTFMQNWLLKQLQKQDKNTPILELFAGSGNFTDVLRKDGFSHITAVEAAKEATAELEQLSPAIKTLTMDIFKNANWSRIYKTSAKAEILLLDPPREGFPGFAEFAAPLKKLKKIIYVSCDVQSFIQNIKPLVGNGWVISELQPIDMFPQTPHIEILASLRKV